MATSLVPIAAKQVAGGSTSLTSGWVHPTTGAAVSYTPTPGDVCFASAASTGAGSTIPSPPSGWTAWGSGHGPGDTTLRLAYRALQAADTTMGAWGNAPESVILIVLRGVELADPDGAIAPGSGNSSTVTYPALTLQKTNGSSVVLATGVHETATDMGSSPSGLTHVQIGDGGHHALKISAIGVASWTAKSIGVNSANNWNTYSFEIRAASATAGAQIAAVLSGDATLTAELTSQAPPPQIAAALDGSAAVVGTLTFPGLRWHLWIDWDNDGDLDLAGEVLDTPETALGLSWERGGSLFGTGPHYGRATVEAYDEAHRFVAVNPDSELAGLLRSGRPAHFLIEKDDTLLPVFAGYTRRIVPAASDIPNERIATIECHDALSAWSRRGVAVAGGVGWSIRDLRLAVLAELGVPSARYELIPEGDVSLELELAGMASELLEEANRATLARHWIRPTTSPTHPWQYVTVDRNHKLSADPDISIQYGGSHGGFNRLDGWVIDDEMLINRQAVRYRTDPTIEGHDPTVTIEDAASVAEGLAEGAQISTDLISSEALAEGVAEHMAWRYHDPRHAPTLVFEDPPLAVLQRDLYDVVSLSDARYGLVDRRLEIVGDRKSVV